MIKHIITAIAFVTGISALALTFSNNTGTRQIYIDTGRVYQGFDLSKQLNKEMEAVLKARKNISDSLYAQLRQRTEALKLKAKPSAEEINEVKQLEENLYNKQQEFEKNNQEMNTDYNSRIWNRLNQYVSDYGKQKGCNFILGATGEGTIMYADKSLDATDELINYVNNRYNDKARP